MFCISMDICYSPSAVSVFCVVFGSLILPLLLLSVWIKHLNLLATYAIWYKGAVDASGLGRP